MKVFRRSRPQNLDEWLEIATRDIGSPSKERVRFEIAAHYGEAVTEYVEQDVKDAGRAALMDLGSPRAAARRFRREHLTAREAGTLQLMQRDPRRYGASGLWMGYLVFVSTSANRLNGHLWDGIDPVALAQTTLLLLLLVMLPTILFVLKRNRTGKANWRLAVGLNMLNLLQLDILMGLGLNAYFELYSQSGMSLPEALAWLLLLSWATLTTLRAHRMWWKVRRMVDSLPEGTPPNTAF